jgi:GT2 family glycosyltransferase
VDLSILIVSHRNPELTHACLESVYEHTHDCEFEVIVVDNASPDGTPDMIEREFPQARLVRSDENLGFARANNRAAELAHGEHLLLLNPDTIVLEGAIDRLLRFVREQAPGLYGGRTLKPDGGLDPSSCWGEQTLWSTVCFATGLSTAFKRNRLLDPESLGDWPRDTVRDVGTVTGCLLMTSRAAWQRLGGFDERFFMYGEDSDLAVRARAAGMPVRITPDATIVHVVGASSSGGRKAPMVLKGRATLMHEHWSAPARALGLACLLAGVGVRAAGGRLIGRGPDNGWRTAWATRRDWSRGYPPAAATA